MCSPIANKKLKMNILNAVLNSSTFFLKTVFGKSLKKCVWQTFVKLHSRKRQRKEDQR